jgi:hypothetical protein
MIDPKKIEEWKKLAKEAADFVLTVAQGRWGAYLCTAEAEALRAMVREGVPALLAERDELIALLREVDRATRAAVPCPICRAPDVAHALDCRLAAFLR